MPAGVELTGRWNGHAWKTVPTPVASRTASFGGGAAIAAAGHLAWAGGTYGATALPMLLRWTGSAWKLTSVPSSNDIVNGVAVTSETNAWAVGSNTSDQTTILHWNGSKWQLAHPSDDQTRQQIPTAWTKRPDLAQDSALCAAPPSRPRRPPEAISRIHRPAGAH